MKCEVQVEHFSLVVTTCNVFYVFDHHRVKAWKTLTYSLKTKCVWRYTTNRNINGFVFSSIFSSFYDAQNQTIMLLSIVKFLFFFFLMFRIGYFSISMFWTTFLPIILHTFVHSAMVFKNRLQSNRISLHSVMSQ